MKTILHLCADIGSDSQPWVDNGYDVIKVGKDLGVENFSYNGDVYGIIANPPCTEFSVVNKGFHEDGDYKKGLLLVNECLRVIKECKPTFWALENPANGRLKDFLGKPTYTYEPWEYGSPWTKRTALWGKFSKTRKIYTKWEDVPKNDKLYIRPTRQKPSMAQFHKSAIKYINEFKCFESQISDDMDLRSLCSQGFAKAFYEANKPTILNTNL